MPTRLTCVFLVAALGAPVTAQQHAPGGPSIDRPWSRALPAVAPNGAAYLRIENGGNEAVRIVSVSSPISERAELHAHEMEGGIMKMRRVHSVEVPARGAVSFEPGGLHVMLIGLKKALVAGESFPLTLELDKAGTIHVTVEVTDGEGPDPSGHGEHGHGRTR